MTYYIVINEWNYPTGSGREFIGDYDTLEEARKVAEEEYNKEEDNFLEVNNGEKYNLACGEEVDENLNSIGFSLNSSQYEEENMFFRSAIIKREV